MLRAWRDTGDRRRVGSPRHSNMQATVTQAGADLATENARLRRENERLRMEREISKRCALSRHRRDEIPPRRGSARDVPGSRPVSRVGRFSGRYYAWRGRPESPRKAANRALLTEIRRVHIARRRRYGAPRIHAALRAEGYRAGRGRIERLMRRHGILALTLHPFRVGTTDSHHDLPIAPNRLDQKFVALRPNRVWLADITYVPTEEGWLYLAVVLGLCTRKIVGWAMRDHMRVEPTIAAPAMAIQRQSPPSGLIHHSDRGSQYAAADYRKVLRRAGMVQSMSRKGNCWDNAPMESCFGSLKNELVHEACYKTRDAARHDLFAYIEGYYNRQRLHSALGYITPEQAERRAA